MCMIQKFVISCHLSESRPVQSGDHLLWDVLQTPPHRDGKGQDPGQPETARNQLPRGFWPVPAERPGEISMNDRLWQSEITGTYNLSSFTCLVFCRHISLDGCWTMTLQRGPPPRTCCCPSTCPLLRWRRRSWMRSWGPPLLTPSVRPTVTCWPPSSLRMSTLLTTFCLTVKSTRFEN